jgi:hypothetical protein
MKKFPSESGAVRLCALAAFLCFVAVAAASAQTVTAEAFNRYYLTYPEDAQVHFYSTGNPGLMNSWVFEGVEGFVSPAARQYTVPLYRFYADMRADHVYTTSAAERANLLNDPYFVAEGIAAHVVPADKEIPETVPLYRFVRGHKNNAGSRLYRDHFYSLSPNIPAGYDAEGICCRVWKAAVQLPDSLLAMSVPGPNAKWAKGSVQKIGWAVWTGGGVVKISYSTNGGQSWSAVADVPTPQNYGSVTNGSYDWKLPADVAGIIRIKIDWVGTALFGMALPLASAQSGNVTVGTVVPNIKRK